MSWRSSVALTTAFLFSGCAAYSRLWPEAKPERRSVTEPSSSQKGEWSEGLRWEFSAEPPVIRPGERAQLRVAIRNTTGEGIEVNEDILGYLSIKSRGIGEMQVGYLGGFRHPSRITVAPGKVLERSVPVYTYRPEPIVVGGRKAFVDCFVARKEGEYLFELYRGWGEHGRLLGTVALRVETAKEASVARETDERK